MRARGLRIFLRAFLLEAPFDQRGKQRAGVAWVVGDRPGVRRNEPFNTNPVLSAYLLGLFESGGADGQERAVFSLSTALGALGDRLIWGILRPLAVTLSLLAAAAGPIPAAAVLVLVYNPPELALRWRSAHRGIRGLGEILEDLEPSRLPRLAGGLARATAMAVGLLGGYWILDLVLASRFLEAGSMVIAAGVAWVAMRTVRLGIWQGAWFALSAAVLGCLAAWMF